MSGTRHRSTQTTHYDVLGVNNDCGPAELRAAYRRLAWASHPDVTEASGPATAPVRATMADINEAWRVLSDPESRRIYDAGLKSGHASTNNPFWHKPAGRQPTGTTPTPPNAGQTGTRWRRQAWVAGIQAQVARLAGQAGRSATQTLLLKSPRANREEYDSVVDALVIQLAADTESRVRAARAAGAAPLDLGVGATLVGIRSVADQVRRQGSIRVTTELLMQAELLDRMWDVMAHELPAPLAVALGGNPRTAKALQANK